MQWCIPSSNWLCIWILKKKHKWPRIPILSLPGCCSNATTATIASHDLTTQKHRSWNVWEPRLSGVRCPKTPGLLSRFTATEADSSYERAGDQRSFSNRGRWGCDWFSQRRVEIRVDLMLWSIVDYCKKWSTVFNMYKLYTYIILYIHIYTHQNPQSTLAVILPYGGFFVSRQDRAHTDPPIWSTKNMLQGGWPDMFNGALTGATCRCQTHAAHTLVHWLGPASQLSTADILMMISAWYSFCWVDYKFEHKISPPKMMNITLTVSNDLKGLSDWPRLKQLMRRDK